MNSVDNAGSGLKPSKFRTALLACGACFSGVVLGLSLNAVTHLGGLIGFGGALGVLLGSAMLSALAMPFIYFIVNRVGVGLWGRYHFLLALTVLVTAFCLAMSFAVGESWHRAAQYVVLCVCMPLALSGIMALEYIFFSVNVRLLGEKRCGFAVTCVEFVLGVLIGAAVSLMPFFGSGSDSVGYALGCLVLAVGCLFYFASVGYLPRFVRPLSVKVTFPLLKEMFLKKPSHKAVFSAVALFSVLAASGLMLGYLPQYVSGFLLAGYVTPVIALLSVLAATAAFALFRRFKAPSAVSIAGSCVAVLAMTAIAVLTLTLPLEGYVLSLVLGASLCVGGFGIGMSVSALTRCLKEATDGTAAGVKFCLGIMTVCFSLGVGAALAAACCLFSVGVAVTIAPFACAALGVSSLVLSALLSAREKKRKEVTEN